MYHILLLIIKYIIKDSLDSTRQKNLDSKYNLIRGSFSRPFRARIFRFALSSLSPFSPSVGRFRSFRQKVAFLLGRAILIAVLRLKKILPRFCDNIAYSSYFVDFARVSLNC